MFSGVKKNVTKVYVHLLPFWLAVCISLGMVSAVVDQEQGCDGFAAVVAIVCWQWQCTLPAAHTLHLTRPAAGKQSSTTVRLSRSLMAHKQRRPNGYVPQ